MQVRFRYSGGIVGRSFGCDIDTEALAKGDARSLLQLVKASKLHEVGTRTSKQGRDLVNYEITIEEGRSKVSAVFDDMTAPQHIEPLLDFLRARARPMPLE